MQTVYPMTPQGFQKIQEELDRLKRIERPMIIQAIAEARAHGDLKENAEYHAAKDRQGLIEARIQYLEDRVSSAKVIDSSQMENDGKVIFGSKVTLLQVDSEEEMSYQIVGEDEANIKLNKISATSPLAQGILGRYVDTEVTIQTPQGEATYEIIAVDYQA